MMFFIFYYDVLYFENFHMLSDQFFFVFEQKKDQCILTDILEDIIEYFIENLYDFLVKSVSYYVTKRKNPLEQK